MGVIAKQSFRGTVVNYLGVVVGFLTTFFVLTRFLSPEEIGLARVLIDSAVIFVSLASLGNSSSILRFYPYFADGKSRDHGFFFLTTLIPFMGFLLFAFLYCIFHSSLQNLFAEKSPLFVNYYYFVLPIAFFLLYQTTFETHANVLMRIVFPKFVREVLTRILLLVVYLLYAFRVLDMDGFVLSLCAVYAVAALCNLVYLLCLGKISFRPDFSFLNRSLVLQWLSYSSFLLLSACVTVLGPTISGFFVTAQLGLDQTGIYAIATAIAVMVSIPYRSMSSIVQPELAKASKEKDTVKLNLLVRQVAAVLMWVALVLLALIWINIDVIFAILPNGNIYAPARYVILFLGIGNLLQASFSLVGSVLSFSRYYYYSIFFSLILAVVTIGLNNWLIPLIGINGAAVATCTAYGIYFITLLSAVWIKLKVSPLSASLWKIVLMAIAMAVADIFLSRLFGNMDLYGSAVLRTVLIVGGACLVSYYIRIVPELNLFADKWLSRITNKSKG